MLASLHIENVAVIENAELVLENGFNVLTGETGAGKSILIDSINLVLGERISKDIVRTGAQAAHVSAMFTGISETVQSRLTELGYDCEDEVLITRDISADGRGTCRISGRPATVSIIRAIGRELVNIHGQHDNQALLSPELHVTYLDKYAGNGELLSEYTGLYQKERVLQKSLSKLKTDESEKARRIDLLNYQIDEIESAALSLDEDEDLRARKLLITNAEKIAASVGEAYASLEGGDGVTGACSQLSDSANALEQIADFYPEIKELASRMRSLSYELDDCSGELRRYTGEIEYDPRELENIEDRLDLIYRLKHKYGSSIGEILEYCEKSKKELEEIETSEERAAELSQLLERARTELLASAEKLSEKRVKAAKEMSRRIQEELKFLDMPNVQFAVSFNKLDEPASDGIDSVEFLISANPGSPPRPLAKIASGGEISRIMLGIKNVLADSEDIETLIFDEVDTGVSGRAAQKIGLKLKQVSHGRQVICVTHLAQIAAQADKHTLIEKHVENGKTYTVLEPLDYEGRKYELARIIGGNITETALNAAAEMLDQANKQNL